MSEIKEVLIGAVTIAVGYVLASLVVKKVMGSATPNPAPAPPATGETKTPAGM
jgi:hypothetical protein